MINLNYAYFHIEILLEQVHGCCPGSSVTPGHLCTKLYRRLADTSSIRGVSGMTTRHYACSYEASGIKVKPQEECAFSCSENHFSGSGVGLNHDAGTSVSCICRVDPNCCERQKIRSGAFSLQRLLGLMMAVASVIPLGLLHTRQFLFIVSCLKAEAFIL